MSNDDLGKRTIELRADLQDLRKRLAETRKGCAHCGMDSDELDAAIQEFLIQTEISRHDLK